jgi:hypothetical protein
MKKYLIPIAVFLFIFLIFYLDFIERRKHSFYGEYNKLDFPATVFVSNLTDYPPKIDEMIKILGNRVIELDTMDIYVSYLPKDISEDMKFYGVVERLPFGPHQYIILLDKDLSYYWLEETLCHEFVHILQMEEGKLIPLVKKAIWEGDTFEIHEIPYKDRPWEKDAIKKTGKFKKELRRFFF